MLDRDLDTVSDMSELPEQALAPRAYTPGELVEGEIVRVDDEGIIMSVGLKMEGMVPAQEMRSLSLEEREQLNPGDTLSVIIVGGPWGWARNSSSSAARGLL